MNEHMKIMEISGDSSEANDMCDQDFYSPLCMSGYLTPLQRKKLREKRNICMVNEQETEVRNMKRRKTPSNVRKTPHSLSKTKEKTKVPHLRCPVSKIIHKPADKDLQSKKFFKTLSSSRLENITFTLPFNDKINTCIKSEPSVKKKQSSEEKEHLTKENASQKDPVLGRPNIPLNSVDLSTDENMIQESNTVDIHVPETKEASETLSENSVFDFEFPADEVLFRRQEKARSVARQHLKDTNSCEELKKYEDSSESKAGNVKLYPIFYISKKGKESQEAKRHPKSTTKCIRDSSKGGEQMILDAGQKDIGVKVCDVCDMIYTIGQEEDEKLHSEYHNKYLISLKFPGWKEENVIGEYQDGKILMVRKGDKSFKLKKIEDILQIANRDLGFPSAGFPTKPDVTFVLFILNDKRIVGCVVAERISSACPVMLAKTSLSPSCTEEKVWRIGNWYSSTESVPAICGINRIWVASDFRRKKVASRMIDCLRCHFIHGHVISIQELAFTDPSADGREFAASYTGTDHFLVYK